MSKQQRRHFSAEEKVKILRLHLLEGKAVSNLCEEHGIQPSLFYTWQKQFFENGARTFNGGPADRTESKLEKQIEDFVHRWAEPAELAWTQLLGWIGLGARKFRHWRARYGKANEHNHLVPRDHWLEEWEKQKILDFYREYPLEGYRRLAFMMLDRDIVAVSPSSVYRVLK